MEFCTKINDINSSKQIFANDNIVAINMDGLKTTDYIGICRLCLCKGNQANQICATQDNVDTVRLVYDCTSILLNTDEILPHNICNKCNKRLTEFKTFRDYCLKNDELIRLHSLIHCDDGDDSSVRPDVESVNDDNGDDLQDIADYVRDELQEELNLKGGDFVFGTKCTEGYEVKQNICVDDVDRVETNHMDKTLALIKRKREQSKEMSTEVTVEACTQRAGQDMGGIIGISIETLDETALEPSMSTDVNQIDYVAMGNSNCADEYFINDDNNDSIKLVKKPETDVSLPDKAVITDDDVKTPPMSPDALALYRRRKRNVPKSGHKYLIDQTLEKPKYYYYVTMKCEICDTVLPRKDMKFHMNDHNGARPYSCDQCDKAYSSPWKRARHIKVVHVDQLLACDQCGVTFKCKMNLTRHLRTSHATAAAVVCTLCERKFSCRDSLKRHMMVHTGERPYNCSMCSKTFTNTFNLKTHLRRHTQEKPYKCELCGCAFGYPGVLKNHLEKVHKCKTTSMGGRPRDLIGNAQLEKK